MGKYIEKQLAKFEIETQAEISRLEAFADAIFASGEGTNFLLMEL